MTKIIKLNAGNINYIYKNSKCKKTESLNKWIKAPDFDGSYMEQMIDHNIPNYIRIGVIQEIGETKVVLFHKEILDRSIKKHIDIKAINNRQVQIQEHPEKYSNIDYFEKYGDLIDKALESILPKITEVLYVNAYDYILDKVIDENSIINL